MSAVWPVNRQCLRQIPQILRQNEAMTFYTRGISRNCLRPWRFPLRFDNLPPKRRRYATIVHNQKYSEGNVPLTVEVTKSCAKVPSCCVIINKLATFENP